MAGVPAATFVDAVERTADVHGDRRGVRAVTPHEASEYRSYERIARSARSIAAALADAGCRPGDAVIVSVAETLPFIEAAFGVMYAGGAFAPVAVGGEDPAGAVEHAVRAVGARLVVADAATADVLGDRVTGVPIHVLDELTRGGPERWSAPGIDASSPAALLLTSGSTALPKVVVVTHAGVLATADACAELAGVDADAVLVGWAPLHHAMGLMMEALVPAAVGAQTIVATPAVFQRRPLAWLELISEHRATVSLAGNFAYELCTRLATDEQVRRLDLSSVRSLITGGEAVRSSTVRDFLARFAPAGIRASAIAPALGMTEALVLSMKPVGTEPTIGRFDPDAFAAGALAPSTDAADDVEIVSCGIPARDTTLRIVDATSGSVLPESAIGEIWVSSRAVSPGYLHDPAATAETFGHRLVGDDRTYLRTGDLGALHRGELYVTGRSKELIIVRGRNIAPQQVEAAAVAVSSALGLAAAFETEGDRPGVSVVVELDDAAHARGDESVDGLLRRIRDAVMQRFSMPGVRVTLTHTGALPRTATGKVRRGESRAALSDGRLPVVAAFGADEPDA